MSSSATASDIPGTGRTLDRFLLRPIARKFESFASMYMERRGYGPVATGRRIEERRNILDFSIPFPSTELDEVFKKDCEKLLKYARYE